MLTVIGVRFKRVGKVYYFDPCGITVKRGQSVIVETARGVECGECAMGNTEVSEREVVSPLKKISPHKLRSTYGTQLYRATGDIYIVADVLGHKDINTTKKHYAAISEDNRKAVADKVKLRRDDD